MLLLENCAKYIAWIWNRTGIGTATNHYGSTTLDHGRDGKEERFNRRKEKKDISNLREGIVGRGEWSKRKSRALKAHG